MKHLLSKFSDKAVFERLEMVQSKCFSDNKQKHVFGCVAGVYMSVYMCDYINVSLYE